MTTKTVNLYEFSELLDKAKDKAREWWRECEAKGFGAHGDLTESAETAAKLLGITFRTHAVPLMSGKDRQEPDIWWALHVQGAGASFGGSYAYAKGAVKAIKAEFGTDAELERIATELAALQRTYSYKLAATITADGRGCHEYVMRLEASSGNQLDAGTAESALLELMRDFARWIYKGIEAEYEYRMSDECIDESIEANGYTFTGNGRRED